MLQIVGEEHKLLILLGKLFYHKSKLATGQKPSFCLGIDRYSSNLTQFSLQREEEMVSSSTWLCILEEGQVSFDEGGLLWRDCRVHIPGPVSNKAGEWFPYEKSLPR